MLPKMMFGPFIRGNLGPPKGCSKVARGTLIFVFFCKKIFSLFSPYFLPPETADFNTA